MGEFIPLTNVYSPFAVHSAHIQVMETQTQAKPNHWPRGDTTYHLILKEGRINTRRGTTHGHMFFLKGENLMGPRLR